MPHLPARPASAPATVISIVVAMIFMACVFAPTETTALPRPVSGEAASGVGVLCSEASLRVTAWIGRWEAEGARQVLARLGLHPRTLRDADLEAGNWGGVRILVVPNARCISRVAAQQVARFVAAGGGMLATEMAGYRDEANRRVGDANTFQWADLFGADAQRFLTGWPRCEYLTLTDDLASEVARALGRRNPLTRLELGRNTAMLVTPRSGSQELASWLDADGHTATTDAASSSAAIVQASEGRVIYVGENLLAPELNRSPEVQALLLALLRRLEAAAPRRATGRPLPTLLPPRLAREPVPISFPAGPATAVPLGGETIRVGVRDAVEVLGASAPGGLRLEGAQDSPLETGAGTLPRSDGSVTVDGDQVVQVRVVNPLLGTPYLAVYDTHHLRARAPQALILRADSPDRPVQMLDLRANGTCRAQAFRGCLEVRRVGERLQVINVLGIDAYTAGVVPNEMPGAYPRQALAAMAIVARTYALSRRNTHREHGYDLCSSVHCQMYGGMSSEWDSTNLAVSQTEGEVVRLDDGGLADTTFHAVCGGVGENVQCVWAQGPASHLVGQPDGLTPLPDLSDEQAFRTFIDHPPDAFCAASPRFRWSEGWTLPQLQALFEKSLPVTLGAACWQGLGTLRTVRVAQRSPRGRVQALEIEGDHATYRVEKDRIRWLWSGGVIGQGGLQSTLFYIEPDPTDAHRLLFRGGGWGHGVGLCQDGARGMASRGMDYRTIVAHYYFGAHVERATPPAANTDHLQQPSVQPSGGAHP